MLVLEIKVSKPPRFDLKSFQRHRNDPSVWRSAFVLLRPKNKVRLPTQSAEIWIYIGKCFLQVGGFSFSSTRRP